MPALTRRGKRQLPGDPEEDEDSGNEMLVGILAQRARRRAAAQEQEEAQSREEEQTGNRVSTIISS
jgi:hypothetical protein